MPKDDRLLGCMVDVEITGAGKHYLTSRLVADGAVSRPVGVPSCLPAGQVSGSSLIVSFQIYLIKLGMHFTSFLKQNYDVVLCELLVRKVLHRS